MFTVYCQQSFYTWKAKLLISLPWPTCQLARWDWPFPFSQSRHLTVGSAGGFPALHTHRGVPPPSLEECRLAGVPVVCY